MKTTPNLFSRYSLSLEELALVLGLINCTDKAHSLMRSVYADITDHQMEARFVSATNSLLACNLMTLSERLTPRLGKELEMLVFPIASHDQLLQLTLITKQETKRSTVYMQKGRRFTSLTPDKDVVNIVEQGETEQLPQYLRSYLNNFGKGSGNATYGTVPLHFLNNVNEDSQTILVQQGWSKSAARQFGEDLNNPILRGSMVLVNISQPTRIESSNANKHLLALLQGKKRSWIIDYPISDPERGMARMVDERSFEESLAGFLSQ